MRRGRAGRRGSAGGHRGPRRGRPTGVDRRGTRAHPRPGPQGGRTRRRRRRRPALGLRGDDGVRVGGDRCSCGRVGVRHRRYRRGAPRVGADRRHLGRSRRDRLAPGDHGVGRSEGVPRPSSNLGVPRDGRCPGPRMAARLVPLVLHPLVRLACSPPGRVGRRSGPHLRGSKPALVGHAAHGTDPRGSRTRRRQPRPRAPRGPRRV